MTYNRSLDDLQKEAVTWWPPALAQAQGEVSVIPKLLETRAQFVDLLKSETGTPSGIFDLAIRTRFPGNLLVKHLAVLTDIGGEGLKRIGTDFKNLFQFDAQRDKYFMDYLWRDTRHRYHFNALPLARGKLDNKRLGIDGTRINELQPISDLHKDVLMLLLFGAYNVEKQVAEKSDFYKCVLGSLLGNSAAIEAFIEERYVWVSGITRGAAANDMGQIAQNWALEYLNDQLSGDYKVVKNGKISVDGEAITSDIQISNDEHSVAIELSFQVTTNSTIERKGNEAENRKRLLSKSGNYAAYIIDGAGNFERKSAVSKICNNSDCTVAFSESELDFLVQFIREKLQ